MVCGWVFGSFICLLSFSDRVRISLMSKSLSILILTAVMVIASGIIAPEVFAAAEQCKQVFSESGNRAALFVERLTTRTIPQINKRVKNNFFSALTPIRKDGLEYLRVRYDVDHLPSATFAGSTSVARIGQLNSAKRKYLESYGIEYINDFEIIVPLPETLMQLHAQKVANNEIRSFFAPVEVNGKISNQEFLEHVSQGRWPIDTNGSIEYLHDMIVHWPLVSLVSEVSADANMRIVKVVTELLKDSSLQGEEVKVANVLADMVSTRSVDFIYSMVSLESDLKNKLGSYQVAQLKEDIADLSSLSRQSRYNLEGKLGAAGVTDLSSVKRVQKKAKALLRELGLVNIFGNLKATFVEQIPETLDQRSRLIDEINSQKD